MYLRMNSMKARFMRNTVHMLISSSARRVLPFVKMRFAALSLAGSEERTHGTSRMRGHIREEPVLRGVRVLNLEDIEHWHASQVRVHEVEGVVASSSTSTGILSRGS